MEINVIFNEKKYNKIDGHFQDVQLLREKENGRLKRENRVEWLKMLALACVPQNSLAEISYKFYLEHYFIDDFLRVLCMIPTRWWKNEWLVGIVVILYKFQMPLVNYVVQISNRTAVLFLWKYYEQSFWLQLIINNKLHFT